MLRQILRGHKAEWFPLLCTNRFVVFDTSVICHVLVYCFGLFLLQHMFLNLQAFAPEGQDMMFSMNVLLTFIMWRQAWLWLEMFAFERFSSETPWLYFEEAIRLSGEIFMFLAVIWCSMYRFDWFIPPLIALVPQEKNVTLLRASLMTVFMLFMPLFRLSLMFHVIYFVLWLAYLIHSSKVLKWAASKNHTKCGRWELE